VSALFYAHNNCWMKLSTFRFPSTGAIQSFLLSQSNLNFTYPAVGATATVPPAGYNVDHNRIQLGTGAPVFHAARAALQTW
jgi:Domain of unknown function (DUF1990)